jgi:hypothetical protein
MLMSLNSSRKGNSEPLPIFFKVESFSFSLMEEEDADTIKKYCALLGDHDKYFLYLGEDHEVFIGSEMPFKRYRVWEHNENSYKVVEKEDVTVSILCMGQNKVSVIDKESLILRNLLV